MKFALKIVLPVLALLTPVKSFACAACYGGNIDSPLTDGMNWGIMALLGLLVPVLGSFLFFFIYLIRKSEALEAAAQNKSPEASNV